MRQAGRWAAILGFVLALGLFAREGFGPIATLLRVGGFGLVLAALFHVVPMTLNARAWQVLVPGCSIGLSSFVTATWMRESVNGLLPVARVGGEVVGYRALLRHGATHVSVIASLLVDLGLSVLSQSAFTLLGVMLMIDVGVGATLSWQLATGFAVLFFLGGCVVLLQGTNVIARLLGLVDRALAGRLDGAMAQSVQIEAGVRLVHAEHRRIWTCLAWQSLGWLAGAGEISLALFFLGQQPTLEHALIIEAFVQTVSSIAFIVPGAFGVQEGAYLIIGAALGIDGAAALALAASRRLRDLVVYLPGLLAWSMSEARTAPQGIGNERDT